MEALGARPTRGLRHAKRRISGTRTRKPYQDRLAAALLAGALILANASGTAPALAAGETRGSPHRTNSTGQNRAVAQAEDSSARPDPGDVRRRRAQARYEQGVTAYEAGRFQVAIGFFREADDLAPTAQLSYNIAQAYEKLGDVARALEYYREYLRREPQPDRVSEVQGRVVEIQDLLQSHGLQQLTVQSVPSGATLSIDGQPVGITPWTGELAPGRYLLRVAWDRAEATREIRLEASEARLVKVVEPAIAPSPPVPATPPQRTDARLPSAREGAAPGNQRRDGPSTSLLVAGGTLTLAGVSAGVGFHLAAESESDDLTRWRKTLGVSACAGSPAPPQCDSIRETDRRHDLDRAISTTGFVVAGAAALATVSYWIIAHRRALRPGHAPPPGKQVSRQHRLWLSANLGPGITGRF